MELKDLAARQKSLKEQIDALEAERKELQKEYDDIRKRQVPELMESEGIDTIRFEGIGTVYIRPDMYVQVKDSDGLIGWLAEMGFSDLIKEGVPYSTLKAFVKEQMGEGVEIPEELVKVDPYEMSVIKK